MNPICAKNTLTLFHNGLKKTKTCLRTSSITQRSFSQQASFWGVGNDQPMPVQYEEAKKWLHCELNQLIMKHN